MKILHIYKYAAPDVVGGIETVIANLAREQVRQGHEVTVLAIAKYMLPGIIEHDGYKVILTNSLFSFGSTPFSWAFLKQTITAVQQADIVNAHFPYPFADFCLMFSRHNKPVIITYHSDIVRQVILKVFYNPLFRLFFRRAVRIIATSPNYFATSKILKRYRKKVSIIPLGMRDVAQTAGKGLVAETIAPIEGPYFLFVGQFRYYKGLEVLLEAANSVSAKIVIIGAGQLGRRLKQIVRKLGTRNVLFVGPVVDEQKFNYYRHARAVVFPSHMRSEAFGMTLVEGAMFGLPLISCEIGTGTTFVNIHGETGIVCTPSDAESLAAAMRTLEEDDALATKFGRTARQRFEVLFTIEKMASDYESLYKLCLEE